MRVAVAGVPGAWSSERMAHALSAEGMESFVFSLGDCLHDLSKRSVVVHDFDLHEVDAIVVKKLAEQPSPTCRLRLHMLRELQQQGVRIYSPPAVIDRVMDRYRMTMVLAAAKLPMPRTFAANCEVGLRQAVLQLGKTVLKPVYTSKGRGFCLIGGDPHSDSEPGSTSLDGPVLAQRFVESPGRDIGACVLGGRFVGAFYRVAADGEWLTTTAAGGRYAPCELPRAARELAEDAAAAFGLDYTVIDLVESDGGYLIYEASAFGGFRGLWEAYNFDVAGKYAAFIKGDLRA